MNFDTIFNQLFMQLEGYLPALLSALVVLVVGWILALIISRMVESILKKFKLNERLSGLMGKSDSKKGIDLSWYAGRIVFYLIMLFVLLGFFQALGLDEINEPIRGFLGTIFAFAPRLIAPVVLLAIAWILATVLKFVCLKVTQKAGLDAKISSEISKGKPYPISSTISETVYWLVFLLFIPAVLDSLALSSLVGPINSMIEKTLAYIPNLLAAGAIFLIGWFVAKIIRKIVVGLLDSIGMQELAAKMGFQKVLGENKLSETFGMVVYVLILIPVLIASLNALEIDSITNPASVMLATVLNKIPSLFSAVVVLVIAYVVGKILGELAKTFLEGVGFNNVLTKIGLSNKVKSGQKSPAELAGLLITVVIVLFAAVEALSLIGFTVLSETLNNLTLFSGHILFGLFVLGIGMFIAEKVSSVIAESSAANAHILAPIAKVAILILAFAMGLKQMGIADQIVSIAFALILGACAVAFGIAFGLGGKDVAHDLLKKWNDKVK